MNGLLLLVGLATGLAHSIYSALSKLLLNRTREPLLLLLYINILQAITTPLLWLFIDPKFPPVAGWPSFLFAGLTGLIGFLLLYMALASGDASSVMPILGSKVIFSGYLAMVLLNENHTWTVYSAALLVAISIGILGYSPSKSHSSKFPLKPIILIVVCSIVFATTDIFMKQSLKFIDSFNFTVYYNIMLGTGSIFVIPYLKRKQVSLILNKTDFLITVISSVSLIVSTVLFVTMFKISDGIVIPNILMSSRGIFIVLISAFLAHRGIGTLETQTRKVFLLRFIASVLIIFSIWIASSH
jgi:drug/metabolite transporter (DMT)-like permease